MNQSENPVIKRLEQWFQKMNPNEAFFRIIKQEVYPFILFGYRVADKIEGVSKKTWYDYVDGIILLHMRKTDSNFQITFEESLNLMKDGFSKITEYSTSPEFQKFVISKFQFRTDIIEIGKKKQTVLNDESLFRFGSEYGEDAFEESTFKELRKKFIDLAKQEYQSVEVPKDSKNNLQTELNRLSVKQIGYMLFFLMDKDQRFTKCSSRDIETMKENLKKLGREDLSPIQVYKKGIVYLKNDEKYKDKIDLVDFAGILKPLKKINPIIAETAINEMLYLNSENN